VHRNFSANYAGLLSTNNLSPGRGRSPLSFLPSNCRAAGCGSYSPMSYYAHGCTDIGHALQKSHIMSALQCICIANFLLGVFIFLERGCGKKTDCSYFIYLRYGRDDGKLLPRFVPSHQKHTLTHVIKCNCCLMKLFTAPRQLEISL
jgi:hypothetical protein